MKGLSFNCLARDHKVTSCRDPIRFWRCRQFGHTSIDCLPSNFGQPPSSRSYHILGGDLTPPHSVRDDGGMVDVILFLKRGPPSPSCERLMDPMLLETYLMFKKQGIEGGASTPSCVVRRHPSTEKKTRPLVLLRSNAEQLVGQELINALRDFKQLAVPPFSPQTHQSNSFVKESSVQCLVGTQVFQSPSEDSNKISEACCQGDS
jgi:hypothetical protein